MPHCKVTSLFIDSEYRTVGDVTDFKVYTNNSGVQDVQYYAIQSVTVPFSWNTIRTGRNTIQWTASVDGVLSVTINDGNYSANDLATELATAMNAVATAGTYSVTYDNITQGFTITIAGDTIRILQTDLDASDLWDELGFTEVYALASNTQISVSAINITGDNRLYVASSKLANVDSYQMTTDQLQKSKRISSLLVSTNPGGVIQDEKNFLLWKEWPDTKITNFDLSLEHENGDLVDLRGRQWQMTILLSSDLPGM
jgi:hypothetical protein